MTERERTDRRRRATRLFEAGAGRAQVARTLGVPRSTAGRWYRIWQRAGSRGMQRRTPPGRRSRLDPHARQSIRTALAGSPRDAGFALERWSLAAVAVLVERLSGERYHRRHVGRLVRSLGWVVAPVGQHAGSAFRREAIIDPEGNPVSLFGR